MKEYIVYCAQEANFQTRSMLIPVEYINKNLEDRLNVLDKYAKKCRFTSKHGTSYIIDKVLTQAYIPSKKFSNCFEQVISPFSHIANDLTQIADFGGEHVPEDCEWIKHCIFLPDNGFDHVRNFEKLLNKTTHKGENISILGGYLILDADVVHDKEIIEKLKTGETMLLPKKYESAEWI